jgi:hypothetical protein
LKKLSGRTIEFPPVKYLVPVAESKEFLKAKKEAARTVPERIKKTSKRGKMKYGGPYWAAAFSNEKPCFTASPQKMANKSAFSLGSLFARTSGSRPVKPKQANKKYPKGIFH